MSAPDDSFEVEVIYALPREQRLWRLNVVPGTTAEQAVRQSGVVDQYPELQGAAPQLGVFGVLKPGDARLNPGDRVEIYRPLEADPKDARRQRAAQPRKPRR